MCRKSGDYRYGNCSARVRDTLHSGSRFFFHERVDATFHKITRNSYGFKSTESEKVPALSNFWSEVAALLAAGSIVALFALPIILIAWLAWRRQQQTLLPPWRPWRAPWGVFEVFMAVFTIQYVIPIIIVSIFTTSGAFKGPSGKMLPPEEASAAVAGMPAAVSVHDQAEIAHILRILWIGILSLPLQLSLLIAVSRFYYPAWWRTLQPSLASRIVLAVLAWLVLAPFVLIVNGAVNVVFTMLEWHIKSHQLTKLAGRPRSIPRFWRFRRVSRRRRSRRRSSAASSCAGSSADVSRSPRRTCRPISDRG